MAYSNLYSEYFSLLFYKKEITLLFLFFFFKNEANLFALIVFTFYCKHKPLLYITYTRGTNI